MKTSLLTLLAPLLASAVALPSSPSSTLATRDDILKRSVPHCKPDVRLDNNDLTEALNQLIEKSIQNTQSTYGWRMNQKEEYKLVNDVKVYVCNYNSGYMGGNTQDIIINPSFIKTWLEMIDDACGPNMAGWVESDPAEGNFGIGPADSHC